MARKKTFTVEGSRTFPLDMLRYDQAHPASDDDRKRLEERGKRRITLTSFHPLAPTEGRWASFQWKVVAQD